MTQKTNIVKTDKPFWFFTDQADEDYIAARLLAFCGESMWHTSAFHSQQSLEKYIKSFLVQESKEYPETHNLKILRDKAKQHSSLFGSDGVKQELEIFDCFEQVSRYGGLANYDPLSLENEYFTTAGVFAWTDSNIKILDKLVFKIRNLLDFSMKPNLDSLTKILKEDKSSSFTSGWKLPIPLKQILVKGNDYYN